MNLYCDNYASCNSVILDRGDERTTTAHARAKGWHLYRGASQSGKLLDVTLCGRCVDSRRPKLAPSPPPLEGDVGLFRILPPVPGKNIIDVTDPQERI